MKVGDMLSLMPGSKPRYLIVGINFPKNLNSEKTYNLFDLKKCMVIRFSSTLAHKMVVCKDEYYEDGFLDHEP